jgi:hypothetical protein
MRNVLDKISVIKFESHISIFETPRTELSDSQLSEISQRIMFKQHAQFSSVSHHHHRPKFVSYLFEDSDLERVKARKYFWINCQNFNFITKPVKILSRIKLLKTPLHALRIQINKTS